MLQVLSLTHIDLAQCVTRLLFGVMSRYSPLDLMMLLELPGGCTATAVEKRLAQDLVMPILTTLMDPERFTHQVGCEVPYWSFDRLYTTPRC